MIVLPTSDPTDLLERIKSAIDRRTVKTWSYDRDDDFTHTAEQWVGQAWLRPSIDADALRLYIVPPVDTHISSAVYAVFHGRFVEMVLRHFDDYLNGNAEASPLPDERDQVT